MGRQATLDEVDVYQPTAEFDTPAVDVERVQAALRDAGEAHSRKANQARKEDKMLRYEDRISRYGATSDVAQELDRGFDVDEAKNYAKKKQHRAEKAAARLSAEREKASSRGKAKGYQQVAEILESFIEGRR